MYLEEIKTRYQRVLQRVSGSIAIEEIRSLSGCVFPEMLKFALEYTQKIGVDLEFLKIQDQVSTPIQPIRYRYSGRRRFIQILIKLLKQ